MCVRVRALYRYFISAEVACLWCRPWVSPIQIINLSAVTRPRPTSKRTAPLLHYFVSSFRRTKRMLMEQYRFQYAFFISSDLRTAVSANDNFPLVNSLGSDAILIFQQTPKEALDILRKLVGFHDAERTLTSDNTPTVPIFQHCTS
jgi:hypothetical protein